MSQTHYFLNSLEKIDCFVHFFDAFGVMISSFESILSVSIFWYYLIYFGYLNSKIVLVLMQLLNRQFVDSFVEFLILNALCIYRYNCYIGYLMILFCLSIFHQILSILLSFLFKIVLDNLLYYHLLMICYLLCLPSNLKVNF